MQMLQHDRHARPTIKEALKHQFNNDGYEVEKAFLGCFGSELHRTALAEVEVELDEIVLGRWGLSPSLRNGTSDERRLCILICWPYYFGDVTLIDAACHAFQVQMLLPTRMATLVTSEKYQVVEGATAPNMHGFFCAWTIKPWFLTWIWYQKKCQTWVFRKQVDAHHGGWGWWWWWLGWWLSWLRLWLINVQKTVTRRVGPVPTSSGNQQWKAKVERLVSLKHRLRSAMMQRDPQKIERMPCFEVSLYTKFQVSRKKMFFTFLYPNLQGHLGDHFCKYTISKMRDSPKHGQNTSIEVKS